MVTFHRSGTITEVSVQLLTLGKGCAISSNPETSKRRIGFEDNSMNREQVIQRAKDSGWRVIDIKANGLSVDIHWKNWEVIAPGKGPVFRCFSEDEAWDYVYERMMDKNSGEA
jgi:hypothetical protein